MRIVLCKGQFHGPISGADETLVTYATQLRAAGHEVSVLLMYPHAQDDQYYLRLREAGVPVSAIASYSIGTSLGAGRRLTLGLLKRLPSSQSRIRHNAQKIASGVAARYYKQCCEHLRAAADLVHVLTPDPSAMVIIRAAHAVGVPVIYQELGTPYHPPDFEAFYEHFTTVLPLCTEVAALSPLLAQECHEKLPPSRRLSVLPIMAEVLRNGSGHERLRPREATFGFAARIESLKGPVVLAEAFAAVLQKSPETQLKIAGAGSEKRRLVERIGELGIGHRCEFSGIYTQPGQKSAFMKSLDVFVLPSLTEGTPNCIAEAMSHGLPVIASAVGGIPDVVTAETGILVPPGDAAALAQAMLRLAQDATLRARMGEAGLERYKKLFSPGAVLPVMLSTYKRVAGRNGSNGASEANQNGHAHPWMKLRTE
ncbi:MAG TPA: glycosyltransferase family 4 protein [Pyrinomonadaceae bacterium]|nr:glycosyltransferase family 4 protein [Pyrinomonadaceae bacterium]